MCRNGILFGFLAPNPFKEWVAQDNWLKKRGIYRLPDCLFFETQVRCSNGILLPKLSWPTERKNFSSDLEKLLKFEAEGREFARWILLCSLLEAKWLTVQWQIKKSIFSFPLGRSPKGKHSRGMVNQMDFGHGSIPNIFELDFDDLHFPLIPKSF